MDVSILPPLFPSCLCLSISPLPPQLGPHTCSGATWTVSMWAGAVSQFTACVNCKFSLTVILYANRRHFIWQMCLRACKTVHRAKEVTVKLMLSLCFSLCWSLTEHSLFGSLSLPLRLSQHWGTGVNVPKHQKVCTSRLLQTHIQTEHKHIRAINTHSGTRLYTHSLWEGGWCVKFKLLRFKFF